MTDRLLVIGDKNLSSWSLRPWLLMRQAGIAFRELVVPFETADWRETIHELSPSGRVPVLRDGDVVVWESLAICEHVAEGTPSLWPAERAARAHARAVSAEMHGGFSHLRAALSMDVVARHDRRVRSTETEREVARVQAIWTECRERFGAGGQFLFGAFSVADAMFAPVVFRFRTYGVEVRQPSARAWYEAMLALPAMQEWERDATAEVAARTKRSPDATPSPTSAQHAFAVIFTAKRRAGASDYERVADRTEELARDQPGFLGIESATSPDGFEITVSYWDSREAIRAFRDHPEHRAAQAAGRDAYYERYEVRVTSVERGYKFNREVSHGFRREDPDPDA